MSTFKAIIVNPPNKLDIKQIVNIGCAQAKKILKTNQNLNVSDILYSPVCGVYVVLVEIPQMLRNKRQNM